MAQRLAATAFASYAMLVTVCGTWERDTPAYCGGTGQLGKPEGGLGRRTQGVRRRLVHACTARRTRLQAHRVDTDSAVCDSVKQQYCQLRLAEFNELGSMGVVHGCMHLRYRHHER